MNALQQRRTLKQADALFESEVARALALYEALDPAVVAADEARLTRILRQLHRQQELALRPLLDHTLTSRRDRFRRGALNLLAREAWYAGDTQRAEQLWRQVVDEGRAQPDALWRTGVQNLALTYDSHGRKLESFLLVGLSKRVAAEGGDLHALAFATARRARALVELGELELAEAELRAGEALLPRLSDAHLAGPARTSLARARARLHMAREEWDAALAALRSDSAALGELAPSRGAVAAGARTTELHIEFELAPERREAVLAAFDEVLAGDELAGRWRVACEAFLAELRLRHALEDGAERGAALDHARALRRLLPEVERGDELVRRLSWLGGLLIEELDAPQLAREVIELAAAECLQRIVQVGGLTADLPELASASEEDLRVLDAQRARLHRGHALLFDRISELWRPGHPAFDLVVEYGIVRVCAWCRRVSTRGGAWMPVAHFLPSSTRFRVSHGICPECHARVAP